MTLRPTRPAPWDLAADRADATPAAMVPCPGCGATVKGANLADHVRRLHGADACDGSPGIVGVDRRIHRTYGVAAGLALAAVGALLAAFPDRTPPPDTPLADALTVMGRSPALVAIGGGLVVMAVVAIVHRIVPPTARVEVVDGAVTLRHRRGTGRIRVTGATGVETGSLLRRVPLGTTGSAGSETSFPAEDVHAGTYLRVARGRRSITVGCASSTRLRKHWTGWATGRRRRWWDVTLAPADFVAFQYALAGAGLLAPKG